MRLALTFLLTLMTSFGNSGESKSSESSARPAPARSAAQSTRHSLSEIKAEQARRNFRDYIPQAWHTVEPVTQFRHNWHLDAVADHLQAVSRRQIKRLLINVAPRTLKSIEVGQMYPTWDWIDTPSRRFINGAYKGALSMRDAVASRRIIDSPWYQGNWGCQCGSLEVPHLVAPDGTPICKGFRWQGDQNAKMLYENDRGGRRQAVSMVPGPLGDGADTLIIDDPNNPEDIGNLAAFEKVIEAWLQVWLGRLNDPKTGAIIVVMQRRHEKDLSGHILEEGGFEHLCIPTEYENPPRVSVTVIGWSDPRTEPGELMQPDRVGPEEVKAKKKRGAFVWASQEQQRPAPAEGLIFKTKHWRFWYPTGTTPPDPWRTNLPDGTHHLHVQTELPTTFEEELDSWDMAFKDEKSSSFVVGQQWARKGALKFLVGQVRDKMAFTESTRAVVKMRRERPGSTVLIEDKANGPAIIDVLKGKLERVIAIEPDGSKEARAHAVTDDCEAGDVYLPHPALFPWVQAFILELAQFPKGEYNDQVDATTQALRRFQKRKPIGTGGLESAGAMTARPAHRPHERAEEDDFDDEDIASLDALTL